MEKTKLNVLVMLLSLAMIIAACNQEPMLSDEDRINAERIKITKNLADTENYVFNYELLLGTWKPVKFAYTKDGKQISGEDFILSDFTVEMIDGDRNNPGQRIGVHLSNRYFGYSVLSYYVNLTSKIYFYKGVSIHYPHTDLTVADLVANVVEVDGDKYYDENNKITLAEFFAGFEYIELIGDELKVYNALEKAYSFVVRNDELIIFFTENKNLNLLILKRN